LEVRLGRQNAPTTSAEINCEINLFFHRFYLQMWEAGRSALRSPARDD
jgi:hypothetical protein